MHSLQSSTNSAPITRFTLQESEPQGFVSELMYDAQHTYRIKCILAPLLTQLGSQPRWQLWLTPGNKLNPQYLHSAGIPLDKSLQVCLKDTDQRLQSMCKALRSGNYSVVLGWFTEPLSQEQMEQLEKAAKEGHSIGFVLKRNTESMTSCGHKNPTKIHSNLYH